MRKFLCILSLMMLVSLLSGTFAFGADDDAPIKGKFKGKGKDKLFEKIDTNNDGKISKEEFETFLADVAKAKGNGKFEGKTGPIAKRLFDKLDTNKDGFLSKEEFAKIGENAGKFGKKKDE